jgi:hypothetical protein
MPTSYRIDIDAGIVFDRAWGVLTDAEVASHARALVADSRFNPDFRQLADFRDVTEVRFTASDVRTEAAATIYSLQAHRAFVVPMDVASGLARVYELSPHSAPVTLGVFRRMGDALIWLGLSPATEWPDGPPDAVFVDQSPG